MRLTKHTLADLPRDLWSALLTSSAEATVFHQAWYCESLSTKESPVHFALVWEDELLVGGMPYLPKKKYGVGYIFQPILARYWGPVCLQASEKRYKNVSLSREVLDLLVKHLKAQKSIIKIYGSVANHFLTPFQWEGFRIESRTTHHIPLGANLLFHANKQNREKLNKANRLQYDISFQSEFQDLLTLLEIYEKSGKRVIHPKYYGEIEALYQASLPQDASVRLVIRTKDEGKLVGAAFAPYWNEIGYSLKSLVHPDYKAQGGATLLIWTTIFRLQELGCHTFDFLGGQTKSYADFMRRFGAIPLSYPVLKYSSLPGSKLLGF